ADAASEGYADDHGNLDLVFGAVVNLGQRGGDLVKGREDEAVKLNLHHGAVAGHGHTDRGAHDAGLGERGVHDAVGPKVLMETVRHTEHATQGTDVLAHEEHLGVAFHGGAQASVDSTSERQGTYRVEGLVGNSGGGSVDGVVHRCPPAGSTKEFWYRSNHARSSSTV